MKKVFVVLLSLLLAACLMSCDNSNQSPAVDSELSEDEAFEVVKAVAEALYEFESSEQDSTPYEASNGYTIFSYSYSSGPVENYEICFFAPESRMEQTLIVEYSYEQNGDGDGGTPVTITSFEADLNGKPYDFTDRADEIL